MTSPVVRNHLEGQPPGDFDGVAIMLIPDEASLDIIEPHTVIPRDHIHMTLVYMGDVDKMKASEDECKAALLAVANAFEPIDSTLTHVDRFPTPEGVERDPVILRVGKKPVMPIRQAMLKALAKCKSGDASEHDFNPHTTLGYIDTDEKLDRGFWASDTPVRFDRIRLGYGGDHTDVDLGVEDGPDGTDGPGSPESPSGGHTEPQQEVKAHDLVFFENRSTPKVVNRGAEAPSKKGYGKVTKRRKATADEEAKIRKNEWIQVDEHGKKGGEDGYKKTKYRPQLVKALDTLAMSFQTKDIVRTPEGVARFGLPIGSHIPGTGKAPSPPIKPKSSGFKKKAPAKKQAGKKTTGKTTVPSLPKNPTVPDIDDFIESLKDPSLTMDEDFGELIDDDPAKDDPYGQLAELLAPVPFDAIAAADKLKEDWARRDAERQARAEGREASKTFKRHNAADKIREMDVRPGREDNSIDPNLSDLFHTYGPPDDQTAAGQAKNGVCTKIAARMAKMVDLDKVPPSVRTSLGFNYRSWEKDMADMKAREPVWALQSIFNKHNFDDAAKVELATAEFKAVLKREFPDWDEADVNDRAASLAQTMVGDHALNAREDLRNMLIPEAKELTKDQEMYAAANMYVKSWSESSADHAPMSVTIQLIARDIFGLDDSAVGHFGYGDGSFAVDELKRDHGRLMEAFLHSVYDETQEEFARRNITEVHVYRGHNDPTGLFDGKPLPAATIDKMKARVRKSIERAQDKMKQIELLKNSDLSSATDKSPESQREINFAMSNSILDANAEIHAQLREHIFEIVNATDGWNGISDVNPHDVRSFVRDLDDMLPRVQADNREAMFANEPDYDAAWHLESPDPEWIEQQIDQMKFDVFNKRQRKASISARMQPLSSWSYDRYETETFGDYGFSAIIPVERIWSSSITGSGCLHEKEIIVTGGVDRVAVIKGA